MQLYIDPVSAFFLQLVHPDMILLMYLHVLCQNPVFDGLFSLQVREEMI